MFAVSFSLIRNLLKFVHQSLCWFEKNLSSWEINSKFSVIICIGLFPYICLHSKTLCILLHCIFTNKNSNLCHNWKPLRCAVLNIVEHKSIICTVTGLWVSFRWFIATECAVIRLVAHVMLHLIR
jgi:hypothetical protein